MDISQISLPQFGLPPIILPRGLFTVFEIAGSGMSAESLRAQVIANNIANANTTRTEKGGPYVRKEVVFMPREPELIFEVPIFFEHLAVSPGRGVRVVQIKEDKETPFRLEYRPEHPDADASGYVKFPNVNVVLEMIDMITAQRAYEANVSVVQATKGMMLKALQIGK
jgi:flagellar basal-body rod protein FlgC